MPSLLDFKDSKNIIIYLFAGVLALSAYVYKGDQSQGVARDKAFGQLIVKESGDLKTAISLIVLDQKEIRREQRAMAIDIATLKVLKNIKGASTNGN